MRLFHLICNLNDKYFTLWCCVKSKPSDHISEHTKFSFSSKFHGGCTFNTTPLLGDGPDPGERSEEWTELVTWSLSPGIRVALPLPGVIPWWLSGKESACQCRRCRFNPWVGKIPWIRKWQPTPTFLPGESHGLRSLANYSPWCCKESTMTEATEHTGMHHCLDL